MDYVQISPYDVRDELKKGREVIACVLDSNGSFPRGIYILGDCPVGLIGKLQKHKNTVFYSKIN